MYQIKKANSAQAKLLSEISVASFLPAHGHSAPKKDIDNYLANNFNEENFVGELENPENQYYLIEHENNIVGYSKVVFNETCPDISTKNITFMSRLYLLKEFYGTGLGKKLFDFNLALSKENKQTGIWLKVWVENEKAINFYKKMGFEIVAKSDFRISETHSNPNHIMFLKF